MSNHPKEIERQRNAQTNETAESDSMSKTDSGETPRRIAEVVDGFTQMNARKQTIHTWSVTSWRNGTKTIHKVNLLERTCTCEDQQYNNEGSEACAHIMKANHVAQARIDVGEALNYDLHKQVTELRNIVNAIERRATGLEADLEADDSGSDPTPTDDAQDGADGGDGRAAEDAAKELQSAFDEHLTDMQVEANDGLVWFKTGYDTEEEWPYPGGDQTFKVVSNPDVVMYVHDGSPEWADRPHEHHDSKPGEYFKNALEPSDVEAYIQEVLE